MPSKKTDPILSQLPDSHVRNAAVQSAWPGSAIQLVAGRSCRRSVSPISDGDGRPGCCVAKNIDYNRWVPPLIDVNAPGPRRPAMSRRLSCAGAVVFAMLASLCLSSRAARAGDDDDVFPEIDKAILAAKK